ncbi:MAG TPA: prephenate dehydrogenase [Pseudonocardiaceae bacterium]
MRPVCVLGLGLIGGSVLRAARAAGYRVWGAAASAEDVAAARADGFDVGTDVDATLARAADEDALVVLAVPLPAVDGVLRRVAAVAPTCPLTDVVSVKEPVLAAVRHRLPGARYVGGHPMAGSAASGWAAGSAELFRGAAWVVTAEDLPPFPDDDPEEVEELDDLDEPGTEAPRTDPELWAEVARLALACGAHVVPAAPAEHDAAVARVSHLPHVLAAVLAAVGADGGPLALSLAAGSFRDGTRVIGTRPELVRAMCEGNRDALLDAVDDALGRLGAARGALASTGSLAATVEAGHTARLEWERLTGPTAGGTRGTTRVDLTAPGALAHLVELGRTGSRVTALEGTVALVEHR